MHYGTNRKTPVEHTAEKTFYSNKAQRDFLYAPCSIISFLESQD
jgi:hypothetical protein